MILAIEGSAFLISIGLITLFKKSTPALGAKKLYSLSIFLSFWLIMNTLFYLTNSHELMIISQHVKYISVVSVPVLFLLAIYEYTINKAYLNMRKVAWLWIVPAITLIAISTNSYTHLFWKSNQINMNGNVPFFMTENGILFWVHTGYSYFVISLGIVLLLRRAITSPKLYRKQSIFILFGCLFSWIPNIFFILQEQNISIMIDPTPLSMLLTMTVFYWGLFRMTKYEILPMARNLLIENMSDMVIVVDPVNTIIDANQACISFIKNQNFTEAIIGSNLLKILDSFQIEDKVMSLTGKRVVTFKKMADSKYYELEVSDIKDTNKASVARLIMLHDITETQETLERLKYLTCYDQLTGIYNRVFFEGELDRFNRTRQLPLSLIVADINGLKMINDAFGHEVGDETLQNIAKILKSAVRSEDIVARIGGDEFAILLPRTSKETTMEIINNINTNCINEGNKATKVSVSLGYATKTDNECSMEEILKEADEHMNKRKLMEGKSAHSELVSSLIMTLKESSFETNEHAERMKSLSLKLGNKLNLSENQMDDLLLLAMLHDLGKVGISDTILEKKGKLSEIEWIAMKKHPEIGYHIAISSSDLSPIADLILSHHERWDGTGYPRNLKEEEIPLLARIIAVIDSFDVMTHERTYKKAMSVSDAMAELSRCSGSQFDPKIVEVFAEIYNNGKDCIG